MLHFLQQVEQERLFHEEFEIEQEFKVEQELVQLHIDIDDNVDLDQQRFDHHDIVKRWHFDIDGRDFVDHLRGYLVDFVGRHQCA